MTHEELVERLISVEGKLEKALEGVSNFRKFQERGSRFFDRSEALMDAQEISEKKKWKRSDKIAAISILLIVLAPLVGLIANRAISFYEEMKQFHDEFKQIHKSDLIPKKSLADPQQQVYSVRNQPQDAGLNWRP